MQKDKEVISREAIQRQTEEFLANGGKIQRLPSKRVAPKNKKWIARLGKDFTPWDRL